ncbi:MAG: cytochrome family [Thermoleophilaceae bacterium]|nr:cytochrome family [Thermoleophilaceae bacterium]
MAAVSSLPPGPRLPRFVQTLGFIVGAPRYLRWARRRYGDVVTMSTLFDSRFVMVFEPELIKQVFKGSPHQLRAGEANALLGPILGERSVLLLDGDEHLRQRRLMLPAFHGQRMKAYDAIMREATDREIDAWPVGEAFELMPSMQALTLDVIMRAVFGVAEGPRYDQLRQALRDMLAPISRPIGLLVLTTSLSRFRGNDSVRRFEEQRARVDELIFDEIARRREVSDLEEREDVFSTLLLARDEDGEPMTDQEIRDELVTLLVAGHETTATALAWTFDLLLHDERALAKLRDSLEGGDEDYLDAVAKESLRVRPVIAGIGRKVRGESFQLGDHTIPPGVEINPSIAMVHARADRYPHPREFRPERFLGESTPDTYTWIPFGGGVRRCIGASFALFEMRVVIRRVLERAALVAMEPEHDPIERRGITMVPGRGVPVRQTRAPRPATAPMAEAQPV